VSPDTPRIPFGAQYYRAPTPAESEWDRDLASIRSHGFDTIKIWAQWRWNEPRPGDYDFGDIVGLLDTAERHGLLVIINTIFDVAPAWFYSAHPDSVMITADGRRVEPRTTAYRQVGGAPGPCYHHEPGRRSRTRFLRALAHTVGRHPALYLWDLWNEPELTCGILREPVAADLVCYCESSMRAFLAWLRRRYSSIHELNHRWNRNYRSWDDVELPRNGATFNDMIDWRLFFVDTITGELALRSHAVREADGAHPVMVHTVPMPYFNQINACSDEYELAKHCDLFGNSLGSHPLAAALTETRAAGKRVINAEIHAVGGSTYNRPAQPSDVDMDRHILVPLARGIKGFLFWQYRPETLGTESPAWGLTDLAGGPTPWLDRASRIAASLHTHEGRLATAMPRPAEVAVVDGAANQVFDWCVSGTIHRHYHSVSGAFMALYDHQYQVDVVGTSQLLENLPRYRVVYYPFPYYMERRVVTALRDWVHAGGTLISEAFFAGVRDVDGRHSTTMPGYDFHQLFGVREDRVLTASTFRNAYGARWAQEHEERSLIPLALEDPALLSALPTAGTDVPAGFFFSQGLAPAGARVLARFADGVAAVTCAEYGAGRAILAGTLLGYAYSAHAVGPTGALIAGLVRTAGAAPVVRCNTPGVRADILFDGAAPAAVVVVHAGDAEATAALEAPELAGRYLQNPIDGGDLRASAAGAVEVKLGPGAAKLFMVTE
jgi:beta-galactosidase